MGWKTLHPLKRDQSRTVHFSSGKGNSTKNFKHVLGSTAYYEGVNPSGGFKMQCLHCICALACGSPYIVLFRLSVCNARPKNISHYNLRGLCLFVCLFACSLTPSVRMRSTSNSPILLSGTREVY